MQSAVILGGGGFLASHIEHYYLRRGWRVISIGRGVRLTETFPSGRIVRHAWQLPHPELAALLAVERPTLCVNAAGQASVAASMVEPLTDFSSSTLLNFQILDSLRRQSPNTAYIYLSSAAVYGSPSSLPIAEDAVIAPISPYGWHKRMSEIVLEEHAHLFGIRAASLRIFSAFGVGLRRQVVWELIVRALEHATDPLQLRGDPGDSRDFVHAADVASAVELVANHGSLEGESYNVATGIEMPISQLARSILHILEQQREIVFDNIRAPGNPSRWHADTTRLTALGFRPRIRLEEGLREAIVDAKSRAGN